MTIDEAIFCMESYLPESTYDSCCACPYYGKHQIEKNVFICESNEAHKMAINALTKIKMLQDVLNYLQICNEEAKCKEWGSGIKFALLQINNVMNNKGD